MKKRRIAVVTGTRAEYGLLRSTMQAIDRHPKLELQLVVTGMHLLTKFGHTVDEITTDGWKVGAKVPMQSGNGERLDQAAGLARGVEGIARYLSKARSDIVVVLGDRIEAMAGALAAVTTGRFLVHIHGGDVAVGDVDEGLRHAITKLAHFHFAATRRSARRIIRMGEQREHVFQVGAPGLDRLCALLGESRSASDASVADDNIALIVFHPTGRSAEAEGRTMSAILRAVDRSGLTPVAVYPNSDPGHEGIVQVLERASVRKSNPVKTFKSLPRDDYLRLLIRSRILVGNSSSGMIESASAGTPVVNVGDRQDGRERSGSSVVDCGPEYESIRGAIDLALRKRPRRGGPTCYGRGNAGVRITEILARLQLTDRNRRKKLSY